MLYLFLLLVYVHAYLEEQIEISEDSRLSAVSTNYTVYSNSNGTQLLLHDSTQLFNVPEREKEDIYFNRFHTNVSS